MCACVRTCMYTVGTHFELHIHVGSTHNKFDLSYCSAVGALSHLHSLKLICNVQPICIKQKFLSSFWSTFVTCSEKRDLPEFFMNVEILAWIDSSVYAEYNGEYNGASFREKKQIFFIFQPLLENECL